MPGGNKKGQTYLNKPALEAASLFMYVWPFCEFFDYFLKET